MTEKAAEKAGLVAGQVFEQGWGESADSVRMAVTAVGRSLVDVEKTSISTLASMTRSAQALADTFDQDVNQVTQVAGDMVRNKLAKNAKQAFDIMTKGFQSGADRAGDFLDTLNEYSPQFRKLGIDGEYALSLISAGMQAGAHNADKVADAIKEFSIRAIDGSESTAEGFKLAGLSAEEMSRRIAKGGPTAQKAFQQTLKAIMSIEDPVKRDAAGVALLGTQWEDLGPKVVGAMAKATPEVEGLTGATSRMAKVVGDDAATRFTKLQRKMEGFLGRIAAQALPLLESLAKKIERDVMPVLEKWVQWLSGPGKYEVAETFLAMTDAGLAFSELTIKALRVLLGSFVSWTKAFLVTADHAFSWVPGIGPRIKRARRNFDEFGDTVMTALEKADNQVDKWDRSVDRMRKEIRLKGDISHLQQRLKTAKRKLADPNLTRPDKIRIRGRIDQLEKQIRRAKKKLGSIKDKYVDIWVRPHMSAAVQHVDAVENRVLSRLGGYRAEGGPVSAGRPYVVGERGPELFIPRQAGTVVSNEEAAKGRALTAPMAARPAEPREVRVVVDVRGGDQEMQRMIRKWIRVDNLLQGA